MSMRTLIPRDIVLYVFLGGYEANSYCKSGEGAVGGQDVFIVLLSFSMRSAFAGMTFMLFLRRCCARTDSDISDT